MDDRASAWTAGSARIHVAISSHPDKCEASAASGALYSSRERVKKSHGKIWHYSPPRRGHIARGPLAKRFNSESSVCAKDCVATSLGLLSPVVHYLAFPQTTGTALVQVAVSSHSHEDEVATASGALYTCERVKEHVKPWHPFTPSPRASGGILDSTSRRSSRCSK